MNSCLPGHIHTKISVPTSLYLSNNFLIEIVKCCFQLWYNNNVFRNIFQHIAFLRWKMLLCIIFVLTKSRDTDFFTNGWLLWQYLFKIHFYFPRKHSFKISTSIWSACLRISRITWIRVFLDRWYMYSKACSIFK